MLVSLNWLRRYVDIDMQVEQLADRFSMSGLNHESTTELAGDTVLDLEVTSNRGDCNGHIGVAREVSVLWDRPLCIPQPQPETGGDPVNRAVKVRNDYSEACSQYTARLIRGVKIGPSPQWLVEALSAIGVKSVNNIVDVTNFVMFESGQPLHAFDFAKIAGGEIRVRRAAAKEQLEAIDHREYKLTAEDCVIADAEQPVAIAGVMGGARSEVGTETVDVLVEAANFTPLAVRRTARRLKLHSPSSYRFERRVDPAGVDWASRRCCELILQVAGGTLAPGVAETNDADEQRPDVTLRFARLNSLLGMDVPVAESRRILTALGCREISFDDSQITVQSPPWRHDLTREVDLIEEVARIYGYDRIPSDSPIPVVPSQKRPLDQVLEVARHVLTAAGISEAMTPSVVTEEDDALLSPWTDATALSTLTPMLLGAKTLRRSILPSLLRSRRANLATAGHEASLFEVAHIYLPKPSGDELPDEQYSLAVVTGHDFLHAKGIVATLLERLGIDAPLDVQSTQVASCDPGATVRLTLGGRTFGFLAKLDAATQSRLKLDKPVTVCELALPVLVGLARLVPQASAISQYPSVNRDINLVVDESVRWEDLRLAVSAAVGEALARLDYVETYRDPERDGADKKRILMTLELQRPDRTLTGEEADGLVAAAVARCAEKHSAQLLA